MILNIENKMVKTLDMQFIRYANIFERVTGIRTKHCFCYNSTILFVVPRHLVARAIGLNNDNLRRMSEILKKRIRIIPAPEGVDSIENFVSVIVHPVRFKAIEVKNNEAIINAGSQSKAVLIGRFKKRLEEMQDILNQYFGIKNLTII